MTPQHAYILGAISCIAPTGLVIWAVGEIRKRLAKQPLAAPDPFRAAQAVFDQMETDAKARGSTVEIHRTRAARIAFTSMALKVGK